MAKANTFKFTLYHGVSIKPSKNCECTAVQKIQNKRFLSDEAPLLPLEECDSPGSCQCVYQHFDDRRSEPRRDEDVGLPSRSPQMADKRCSMGRRITDG